MMGVEAPETCWTTHKHQVINLWNCCIWLVNLFELYDDARTCQRRHLLIYNFGNTSYRCNAAVMGRITDLCTLQNTMNTTERNCIISHAQTTTALWPNVFLNVIHRLVVTKMGRWVLSSANDCQGQLQTLESDILILFFPCNIICYFPLLQTNSYKTVPRSQHESQPRRHKIHCDLK
jgi:hypothetical protein